MIKGSSFTGNELEEYLYARNLKQSDYDLFMKYANKGNNNNEDNNNDIENDPDSERLYDKAVRLFGGKGIPYLYGGEDSNGMDCSGLMNATMYDE